MSEQEWIGWHFLAEDCRLRYRSRRLIEADKTYACRGRLELCVNGMHASRRAIDAIIYAPGPIVCRVTLGGEILEGTDKACARRRTVHWMADATTTLFEFACWCAEQALLAERAKGREPQPASWAVIETRRKWLRGEATDNELSAAGLAAWSAAWSAAGSAAGSAAWSAAESAARSAAESAQNDELERRLLALAPAKVSAVSA